MVEYEINGADKDFAVFIKPYLENKHVIALDGHEGTGKSNWFSPLIKHLSSNSEVFHLDHYVRKQKRSFRPYILKSKEKLIGEIINTKSNLIIIEGILVIEKLKSVGVCPDLWIYVKKMANYGWKERVWLDKDYMKEYPPEDLEFHTKHPRLRQIYKYHMKYQPQIRADIVLNVSSDLYK